MRREFRLIVIYARVSRDRVERQGGCEPVDAQPRLREPTAPDAKCWKKRDSWFIDTIYHG